MLFPTVSLSAAIFAGLTVAQFNGLPTCAVSLTVFAPCRSPAWSCMPPRVPRRQPQTIQSLPWLTSDPSNSKAAPRSSSPAAPTPAAGPTLSASAQTRTSSETSPAAWSAPAARPIRLPQSPLLSRSAPPTASKFRTRSVARLPPAPVPQPRPRALRAVPPAVAPRLPPESQPVPAARLQPLRPRLGRRGRLPPWAWSCLVDWRLLGWRCCEMLGAMMTWRSRATI